MKYICCLCSVKVARLHYRLKCFDGTEALTALKISPVLNKNCYAHLSRGFTLLEIMCAICVVAVLAALATPAYRAMLERGNSAKCMANLSQIGNALHLYLADNDGTFPPAPGLVRTGGYHPFTLLGKYLSGSFAGSTSWNPACDPSLRGKNAGVFWCPSDRFRQTGYQDSGSTLYFGAMSYNVNVYVGADELNPPSNGAFPPRIQGIGQPAGRTIYAVDGMNGLGSQSKGWPWEIGVNTYPFNASYSKEKGGLDFKHGGFANAVFLDGHCEGLSLKQTSGSYGYYVDFR